MSYQPKGKVVDLLQRMEAEPERIFTSKECAEILRCPMCAVPSYLEYAIRATHVYKRKVGNRCEYSASPMEGAIVLPPAKRRVSHPEKARPLPAGWLTDPDHPRIGKIVPGWKPPVMQCVRLGA